MIFLVFSDVNIYVYNMNQYDILQSTKSVIQGLDALKTEHEKILETIVHSTDILSSNKIDETVDLLRKSMDIINSGL